MIESFPIVPATGRGLWIIIVIVMAIFVIVGGMLVATAHGSSATRFELSEGGLRIRGDLYGRLIPASALRGDAARVVDLTGERELGPRLRTFGTAVPGYSSGWFRLRNGEKALLYVTERRRAVYVPTTAGYSVLLSPRDPDRFVERLREIAASP